VYNNIKYYQRPNKFNAKYVIYDTLLNANSYKSNDTNGLKEGSVFGSLQFLN